MTGLENIVLLGFMGTGKSTVGRRLAKALSKEFIDTDAEIERITGLTVAEVFRRYGETRFRSEEKLLVKRLSGKTGCVIATGGGTVVDPENWEALAKNGVMIQLYAPLDTVLARITQKGSRPLLKGNRDVLARLWAVRQLVYGQAAHTVDTTDKDVDGVVKAIVDLIWKGEDPVGRPAQD